MNPDTATIARLLLAMVDHAKEQAILDGRDDELTAGLGGWATERIAELNGKPLDDEPRTWLDVAERQAVAELLERRANDTTLPDGVRDWCRDEACRLVDDARQVDAEVAAGVHEMNRHLLGGGPDTGPAELID